MIPDSNKVHFLTNVTSLLIPQRMNLGNTSQLLLLGQILQFFFPLLCTSGRCEKKKRIGNHF
jgi:hypothetical protein